MHQHFTYPQVTDDLEELAHCCAQVATAPDVAAINLTILTPYAVQLRYDASFWPDHATAHEAVMLAEQVRRAVMAVVPPTMQP
ncbi:MAG: hypothetical protein EOM24_35255 [Chloroflexia bacterium]|nr:hypothetical protein [Chloroflexia bacterium]